MYFWQLESMKIFHRDSSTHWSLPQSLRWTSSPHTNNFQPLHPVDSLEVHEAAINNCGTMDLKKGIETDNSKGERKPRKRCRAASPTYAFVLLVDPSAVGVRDHRIDNSESLSEAYRMMPRGRLSIIFAVPPNGSGFSMTTEIPWSVLVPELRKSMIRMMDGDKTFAGTIRLWLQLNTMEIDISGTRSEAKCVHDLRNFADDGLTAHWLSKSGTVINILVLKMYLQYT
ncbi:hypothetical protein FOXB_07600 [Fusarium oxysporum f. sp. conglutinans Fo5176]|uniref:Uncharacterized protein n=1 Tax=Fusarium oxysporum (strain Fo5176) TaxID=660025 RepID=F9FMH0_FUSOF|nr:hypothetical protein FOXB_07600 [Fusarium oxysporum f. sp. conglutinans Fo5176]